MESENEGMTKGCALFTKKTLSVSPQENIQSLHITYTQKTKKKLEYILKINNTSKSFSTSSMKLTDGYFREIKPIIPTLQN